MYSIQAENIAEAHQKAVKTVLECGETVFTEDGKATLELYEPLCITINHPTQNPMIHHNNPFTKQMMDIYALELLDPDKRGFVYTYGNRLHEYPHQEDEFDAPINQIDAAIARLNKDKTTRRAISITWVPAEDIESATPPCLQFVQYMIRGELLNCTAYFRSNDICNAYGANAYGLTVLMMKIIANLEHENINMGILNTVSNCAHVYDTDFQIARKIAYG